MALFVRKKKEINQLTPKKFNEDHQPSTIWIKRLNDYLIKFILANKWLMMPLFSFSSL